MVRRVQLLDEYFATLDPATRAAVERLRALAMDVAPDAEQGSSYGLAALRYRAKPLFAVQATKRHLSLYPFSPAAIDAVRDRLGGFGVSKGAVRFSVAAPLPEDVVRDLLRARKAEIDASGG
jgi:uncharacterized protein YdhG (YjbR/CyaY superfamily)